MGSVKGRWLIPDEHYSEYLDLLDDYLNKQKGRPLNLVEQPRIDAPKPLLIDLDFKFPISSTLSHQLTNDHIRKFVNKVTEGLTHFFNTDVYEKLRFFISLRPQAYADGKKYIKDGIHIQCPDISLTNEKQKVLRLWLLEQEAIQKSFDGIGYINDIDDIYDESMVRKQGWFFYGESKPNIPPYKLESVLAYQPEAGMVDEEDVGQFTPRELLELLSVRFQVADDDNEVREEQKDTYEKYLKNHAPTVSKSQHTHTNDDTQTLGQELGVVIPTTNDGEEIELACKMVLECLSEDRADNYKTWMEVGWCLYNVDPSEEMFDTWKQFSQKSGKSGATDWNRYLRDWMRGFSRNTAGAKLTLKSLHYWARDDNLERYKEIVEEDHVRFVQYRLDDTHFHTARLLQRMYKGRFCASVESRRTEWFVYDEKIHSWRHTNQGIELQEKLSTEVADLIVRARMRLKKQGEEDYDNVKKQREEDAKKKNVTQNTDSKRSDFSAWFSEKLEGARFDTLLKVEKHLYQQEFKGGVMRAAVELFHEEDFANRLNMNPYLFVCANGVIDLHNQIKTSDGSIKTCVVFRDGRPDDYMSQLAGRNYPDSEAICYRPYDPADPEIKELMEFLIKIFPNKQMMNYYIRLMASCLEGNNREQCYYTFIGVGGNGKSKVIDLMRYTFGDYCSSLAATALTRPRPDSGAANPDIIAIKNKRFIYLQEPDDREPLNTSRMKQFSGEDVVEARGLFEDQQRFRITGKLFMMCNRFPPINAMDRGTWRRIRVLLFGSKFVDASDPELKSERPGVFLRDNDLDSKLRQWREAWLSLLVHTYETEYLVGGLEPIPAIVMEQSNKYKESFDQYGKFKADRMVDFRDVRQNLEERGDEQVMLKDVMMAYNNWTRANEGALSGKKLNKQELQNRLEEDFGNLDGGVFKRCVVFCDDDGKAEFVSERTSEA